jgi:hypothetical protein
VCGASRGLERLRKIMLKAIWKAPPELAAVVTEFWPESEWDNAVSIAFLESHWSAFAENDSRTPEAPCGAELYVRDGVTVTAEWSIGWFQINACNLPPDWKPAHLFNTRHNAGTAHELWSRRGWQPWLFSARKLGLA